jgi:hypothetical protein
MSAAFLEGQGTALRNKDRGNTIIDRLTPDNLGYLIISIISPTSEPSTDPFSLSPINVISSR